MEALLKVQAYDKETMDAHATHVREILVSACGDSVKIAALGSLSNALPTPKLIISHCNFEECCCEVDESEEDDHYCEGDESEEDD